MIVFNTLQDLDIEQSIQLHQTIAPNEIRSSRVFDGNKYLGLSSPQLSLVTNFHHD